MKKLAMSVLALGLIAAAPANAASWKQVGGTFLNFSGTQGTITLPLELGYDPVLGNVLMPAQVTHFIVRIGPGSVNRGCSLATADDGGLVFTGVLSPKRNLQPTKLVDTYGSQSPGRQDWTNFKFEVNGGQGAPVQAIQPAFKRLFPAVQCYYEVLYTNEGTRPIDP